MYGRGISWFPSHSVEDVAWDFRDKERSLIIASSKPASKFF